uniref:Uncharacterized protein n=1 Tax=Oryza sativa subsp. japonica TaxID=39947 RepID=Q6YTE5_ORYSJ|nr:hypothetical protein [Oryza sativa Japonica Group]BAD17792.1 hypothetical protein [Oryza sativa Japonica Group]
MMLRDMWIRQGGVGEDPWASWHSMVWDLIWSLVMAVLHGLDDPGAEEDEADPADKEFFQEQAGYDEF